MVGEHRMTQIQMRITKLAIVLLRDVRIVEKCLVVSVSMPILVSIEVHSVACLLQKLFSQYFYERILCLSPFHFEVDILYAYLP